MAKQHNDNIRLNAPKAIEDRSFRVLNGASQPYASLAEANSLIPVAYRYKGLPVYILEGINTVEYWYRNGTADADLVKKSNGLEGLEKVDNTSDAEKWAAAATLTNKTISGGDNTLSNIPQAAINGLSTSLAGKVDKDGSKVLSDNNYTSTEKTKLAGIAPGATANAADAQLRDRSTHSGSQPISSITGLQSALNLKTEDLDGALAADNTATRDIEFLSANVNIVGQDANGGRWRLKFNPDGTVTAVNLSGAVTLVAYWGWKGDKATLSATQIQASTNSASFSDGAPIVADFRANTAPMYLWVAEPSSQPAKTKWYENVLNNGNIGGAEDLFAAPVLTGSYRFYITQYPTQNNSAPIELRIS